MVLMMFAVNCVMPRQGYAQAVFNLPQPGAMIGLSESFMPVVLKGMAIHREDPLLFDFMVDNGNTDLKGQALTDETTKLVKYFLAGLAVPEKELWVNLSPVEKDRIMAGPLSHTDAGRDMLAQDYILKQVTSSLMYPEQDLGRKFWDEIYRRVYAKFGNTQVPVDTFNKVWITPDEAEVYQQEGNALVTKAHLKVMLESDYMAAQGAGVVPVTAVLSPTIELARDVVRTVILPVLEKEVNTGRNFAPLRQLFHSLILAGWYKGALKDSLLNQVYAGTNKVDGIDIAEKNAKEKVYSQYLQAYQKGVYNYVKEEFDRTTQETLPRKYFSGGLDAAQMMHPKVIGERPPGSSKNFYSRQNYRLKEKIGSVPRRKREPAQNNENTDQAEDMAVMAVKGLMVDAEKDKSIAPALMDAFLDLVLFLIRDEGLALHLAYAKASTIFLEAEGLMKKELKRFESNDMFDGLNFHDEEVMLPIVMPMFVLFWKQQTETAHQVGENVISNIGNAPNIDSLLVRVGEMLSFQMMAEFMGHPRHRNYATYEKVIGMIAVASQKEEKEVGFSAAKLLMAEGFSTTQANVEITWMSLVKDVFKEDMGNALALFVLFLMTDIEVDAAYEQVEVAIEGGSVVAEIKRLQPIVLRKEAVRLLALKEIKRLTDHFIDNKTSSVEALPLAMAVGTLESQGLTPDAAVAQVQQWRRELSPLTSIIAAKAVLLAAQVHKSKAKDSAGSSIKALPVQGGIDLGQGEYLKVVGTTAAGLPQFDLVQLMQWQKDLRGLVPVPVGVPQPVTSWPIGDVHSR